MDAKPVHMTKKKEVTALSAAHDDGLDGHQAVVLDWFLLCRTRWLAAVSRAGPRCARGARREGAHDVGGPGKSFVGWALAASGLVPPRGSSPAIHAKCPCMVDGNMVSVMGHPTPVAAAEA